MSPENPCVLSRSYVRLALDPRRHDNVLWLVGELDLSTAGVLTRMLLRLESTGRPLTLELSRLRFVDSHGWSSVEDAASRRLDRGLPPMTAVGMSTHVQRLVSILQVSPSLSDAFSG